MKKNIINKILLTYILFIPLISFNSNQKRGHGKQKSGYNGDNHARSVPLQTTFNQQLPNQYIQQTGQNINQPIANQQYISANQQQITTSQINNQQPITAQNISRPLYEYNASTTFDMTKQVETVNGNNLTITKTLDPIKAAILIREIDTLKRNYDMFSEAVQHYVIKYFNLRPPESNIRLRYNYSIQLDKSIFDPTKQLINLNNNTYYDAPAPSGTAINPYTGLPVTLQDLVILKEIRRLYINEVHSLLFILANMEANSWNVKQIYQNINPLQIAQLKGKASMLAYDFNVVRALWAFAVVYIGNGEYKTSLNI